MCRGIQDCDRGGRWSIAAPPPPCTHALVSVLPVLPAASCLHARARCPESAVMLAGKPPHTSCTCIRAVLARTPISMHTMTLRSSTPVSTNHARPLYTQLSRIWRCTQRLATELSNHQLPQRSQPGALSPPLPICNASQKQVRPCSASPMVPPWVHICGPTSPPWPPACNLHLH